MGRATEYAGRACLPFRAVNRRGEPGHDPGLQRHHLLPRQLLSCPCFAALFDTIGRERMGFDDFRRNGILLPARDEAVWRTLLPLHRGPHRDYNDMVIDRVGTIERCWAGARIADQERAARTAIEGLALLQQTLRKSLLDQSRPILLNRRDPCATTPDFSELDDMAEALWAAAA